MPTRPQDTSTEAWAKQKESLAHIGPEARVAIAIEMSEAVRSIQMQGALDRNPTWSREDAIREIVQRQHGITLPEGR